MSKVELDQVSLTELPKLRAQVTAAHAATQQRAGRESALERPADGRVREGKVDKHGYVQINVRVRPHLKNRLVVLSRETGRDMTAIVEAALAEYLQRNGG